MVSYNTLLRQLNAEAESRKAEQKVKEEIAPKKKAVVEQLTAEEKADTIVSKTATKPKAKKKAVKKVEKEEEEDDNKE